MSVLHSICCHLFSWHPHKPKVTQEALASLALYPTSKRKVKRLPK